MNISIAASIFFTVAVIVYISGFWVFNKSADKISGIVWVPITCISQLCFHVLCASLLNLLGIPVNIVTLGVTDIVAGAYFWMHTKKNGLRQEYEWRLDQLLYVAILAVVVIVYTLQRYGSTLQLTYATIDPAVHLWYAMDVVNTQSVNNMFYAALNNALLIEMLAPLTTVSEYYRIFVLGEGLHLFLAGLMFYAVLQRWIRNNFLKVVAIVFSFLYLLGYPLNNSLYGFNYLGMGVTVIAYLIAVTDSYIGEESKKGFNIFLLMLGCLGIFECYMLFMPVVFLSIFFCIGWKQLHAGRLFTVNTMIEYLEIFLLPCIIGLYYAFFGVFSGDVTVTSAIAAEGAIYRDLYSNFLPLMPFALLGIYQLVKKKNFQLVSILLPLLSIFTLGMFYFGLKGKVSSYYFYKNYYLLWLVFFLVAFIGIAYLSEKSKEVVVCSFITWASVAMLYVSHLEPSLNATYPLFVPMEKADKLNDVYSMNYQLLHAGSYHSSKMDLYQYVYKNLVEIGEQVPLAGGWDDDYWYQAITNQRLALSYQHWKNEGLYFETLQNEANYVLVLYDNDLYTRNQAYFDNMEHVYENDIGFVAWIK